MAVAQAQAESPGLSRFVLPILGLIGLGFCVAGILVLYDPQGGPNLLASIYDAIGIPAEHQAAGGLVVVHHRKGDVRAVERHVV